MDSAEPTHTGECLIGDTEWLADGKVQLWPHGVTAEACVFNHEFERTCGADCRTFLEWLDVLGWLSGNPDPDTTAIVARRCVGSDDGLPYDELQLEIDEWTHDEHRHFYVWYLYDEVGEIVSRYSRSVVQYAEPSYCCGGMWTGGLPVMGRLVPLDCSDAYVYSPEDFADPPTSSVP